MGKLVWSPFGLSSVVAGVAVAGIALMQTQTASAATVWVEERPGGYSTVFYAAAAGEANNVTVTQPSQSLEITDTGATITVGTGCVSLTPQTASCSSAQIYPTFDVELGDESDFIEVGLRTEGDLTFLRGGEGNDTIVGGNALRDYLFGGPGNDILRGRDGGDVLDGGPGADILRGGSSGFWGHGDIFYAHLDRVIYQGRVRGVRADPDGVADDGEPGERDNIGADIESITGGSGNDILTSGPRGDLDGAAGDDVLVGKAGSNWLLGGAGDDTLRGGPGRDGLEGGRGDDTLRGGLDRDFLYGYGGHDFLSGGKWADQIWGGNGNDVIVGGSGRDALWGGEADDLLLARDGYADTVAAGLGRDRARVDRFDRVRGVERHLP